MSRPQKEGLDYFPHDTDASSDEKLEALRSLYGNDGYAFYFILLERIYRTPNIELDISDAETREETMQILARKVSVTIEKFNSMLNTALKWGCFDRKLYEEKGILTSSGVKKRAAIVLEKREKMKQRYAEKVSAAETGEKTPQRKEKKRKVKESKVKDLCKKNYAENVTFTEEEHAKLLAEFGQAKTDDFIERLNLYKGSTGTPYASDYLTILNWDRKDREKGVSKTRGQPIPRAFSSLEEWANGKGDP